MKKIPISDFVSEKELKQINKIINNSNDVESAYDRIEILLEDKYSIKDLGTNRLVFVPKKKKYSKKYVIKVAGDLHGVEANYREFYNGDLDGSITFSYSISKDGTVVVQERVKPFDSDMMKKYKKKVREMLSHLSKKILLVDCKIQNFKNFGIRDNGEIVLLDHGDTVPLPKHQTDNIVNADEEFNVSLRCRRMICKGKTPRPCDGKLKYSKNFDYLICDKCEAKMSINDAYKEFYGARPDSESKDSGLRKQLGFDPIAWKKEIESYCINTMTEIDKSYNDEEGEEKNMNEKIINGKKCKQIRGFWIPNELFEIPAHAMTIALIKNGTYNPDALLKKVGLNPNEYKVDISDHAPNNDKKLWNSLVDEIAEYVYDVVTSDEEDCTVVMYDSIIRNMGIDVKIDSINRERDIFKRLVGRPDISKVIYKPDRFVIYKDYTKSMNEDDNYTQNNSNGSKPHNESIEKELSDKKTILVNNILCYVGNNYYVPALINDIVDDITDDAKVVAAMRNIGLNDKLYKIESPDKLFGSNEWEESINWLTAHMLSLVKNDRIGEVVGFRTISFDDIRELISSHRDIPVINWIFGKYFMNENDDSISEFSEFMNTHLDLNCDYIDVYFDLNKYVLNDNVQYLFADRDETEDESEDDYSIDECEDNKKEPNDEPSDESYEENNEYDYDEEDEDDEEFINKANEFESNRINHLKELLDGASGSADDYLDDVYLEDILFPTGITNYFSTTEGQETLSKHSMNEEFYSQFIDIFDTVMNINQANQWDYDAFRIHLAKIRSAMIKRLSDSIYDDYSYDEIIDNLINQFMEYADNSIEYFNEIANNIDDFPKFKELLREESISPESLAWITWYDEKDEYTVKVTESEETFTNENILPQFDAVESVDNGDDSNESEGADMQSEESEDNTDTSEIAPEIISEPERAQLVITKEIAKNSVIMFETETGALIKFDADDMILKRYPNIDKDGKYVIGEIKVFPDRT